MSLLAVEDGPGGAADAVDEEDEVVGAVDEEAAGAVDEKEEVVGAEDEEAAGAVDEEDEVVGAVDEEAASDDSLPARAGKK